MNTPKIQSILAETGETKRNRAKFHEKAAMCEQSGIESQARIAALTAAHELLEKRFICDEASIEAVQASRAELENEISQSHEIDRLRDLAISAVKECDQELERLQDELKGAIFKFCQSERDKALQKIQSDKALKENLLNALAAWANNGKMQYVVDSKLFAQQYLSQILPEISREEIEAEIQKFSKNNDL